mmetsp:Transcript_3226/g.7600  ORF Transcript_3226/g.7600 Transcript_3226/m.7600 type:complete len:242 (+) Transcript_3226:888-1613(+)
MRQRLALVIDVGPVGTSVALQRNLWIASPPRICQTVRAMPLISPRCRALRSPIKITGASMASRSEVNSVRPSISWDTCLTLIAVWPRLSGSLARWVETTTSGVPQAFHRRRTMRQLRSRLSPPLSSLPSTKSSPFRATSSNFDLRQKTPQPSGEPLLGRLWKTPSQQSARPCKKKFCWSFSTNDITSGSLRLSCSKTLFLRCSQLKCASWPCTASISSGVRIPSTYLGQGLTGLPEASRSW